jgi:hypothetical protein
VLIVGELAGGVRRSRTNDKIADFIGSCSGFLAKINGDVEKLAEVLGLLEYERQTWQMVCDKLGAEVAPATPVRAHHTHPPRVSKTGLSLEA